MIHDLSGEWPDDNLPLALRQATKKLRKERRNPNERRITIDPANKKASAFFDVATDWSQDQLDRFLSNAELLEPIGEITAAHVLASVEWLRQEIKSKTSALPYALGPDLLPGTCTCSAPLISMQ